VDMQRKHALDPRKTRSVDCLPTVTIGGDSSSDEGDAVEKRKTVSDDEGPCKGQVSGRLNERSDTKETSDTTLSEEGRGTSSSSRKPKFRLQLDMPVLPEDGAPAPRTHRGTQAPEAVQKRKAALEKLTEAAGKYQEQLEAKLKAHEGRRRRRIKTWAAHISDSPTSNASSSSRVLTPTGDYTPFPDPDEVVILFDWDDTLLPTSFISAVLRPSFLPGQLRHGIPTDSCFYEDMKRHAEAIEMILRATRDIAHVAIVTLATRPWVESSSRIYLPGTDIPAVLRELGIPVYYAQEHLLQAHEHLEEEGVDLFMIAKRNAFAKHLRKVHRENNVKVTHVLSIGDSEAEQEAVKDVVWSCYEHATCLTVMLMEEPSIKVLSDQLQLMSKAVSRLITQQDDLDINVDDAVAVDRLADLVLRS